MSYTMLRGNSLLQKNKLVLYVGASSRKMRKKEEPLLS